MLFLDANRDKVEGEKVGARYIAQLIKEESIPYWDKKAKRGNCNFDTLKKLDTKSLVHAVQVMNEVINKLIHYMFFSYVL